MAKQTLTERDFKDAASIIGCEVAAIKAVAEVESRQNGFSSNDEPTILFERHIFSKLTKGLFDKSNPDISNPKAGGYGKESEQHGRLQRAVALNREAALMSTSWGKFQIMGFNYAIVGFGTLQEFINAMYSSERDHLLAFTNYVIHNSLNKALQDKNWKEFALRYNGSDYWKNKYDTKLAAAYKKYK